MVKSIKDLVVAEKLVEREVPGIPGFIVRIRYQGRQAIRELAKKATVYSLDQNMQKTEKLDIDLFNKLFVGACIVGWKGLTMENLSKLVLIEQPEDLTEEVPFSVENAEFLITSSEVFDKFVNATAHDLDAFR